MGKLSKNLEFNNGNPISFETIKANREQAVKELSEDNEGLEELFNTCIDKDIKTIVSCGDKNPHMSFEINDKTRNSLVNLVAILDTLYNSDRKIFDICIGSFKKLNDLYLDIKILTTVEESIKYFRIMSEILINSIRFQYFEKFELMEKLVLNLSQYAQNVYVNLDYGKLENNIDTNFGYFYDYEYTLYISCSYKQKSRQLNEILNNTDYYLGGIYCDCYGIIDTENLKNLINAFSINNRGNIIDLMKKKILKKNNSRGN